jgi:hypothetical protein
MTLLELKHKISLKTNKHSGHYPHKKACEIYPEIKDKECWEWTGRLDRYGYGTSSNRFGTLLIHRQVFLIAKGHLDKSLDILHKCDNSKCIRPLHIFEGTHQDNMCDRNNKDRQARGKKLSLAIRAHALRGKAHYLAHKGTYLTGAKHRQVHGDYNPGERNGNVFLSEKQVLRIFKLRKVGLKSVKELAIMFGVSGTQIYRILSGASWKCVKQIT